MGEQSQPGASRKHPPKQKLATGDRGWGRVSDPRCIGTSRQGVGQMAAGTTPKPWIFLSYLNRLLKIQPRERSEVGQLLALKFQEVPRYGGAGPGPQQPQRCRCSRDPAAPRGFTPLQGVTRPPAPQTRQRLVIPLLTRGSSGGRWLYGGMLWGLSSTDKSTWRYNFHREMQIPYGRDNLHRGQVKAGLIRAIGDSRSLMEGRQLGE